MLQYFQDAPAEVCGRFKKSQLEKEYSVKEFSLRRQWLPSVFASLFLLSSPAVKARAAAIEVRSFKDTSVEQHMPGSKGYSATDTMLTISGKVIDENNVALPGVIVSVLGTELRVSTDANGNFELGIPNKGKSEELVVEFKYLGFETKQELIADDNENKLLQVKLEPAEALLGEVAVVAGGVVCNKPTLWQRIKNFFR